MSSTHAAVTKQQVLALQALINAGFAVIAFTPAELSGMNPRDLERKLIRYANQLFEGNDIVAENARLRTKIAKLEADIQKNSSAMY